jgi:hypothetical protein
MMCLGGDLSGGAIATMCVAAVLIYFIMRCRAGRATRKGLAISVFCAAVLIVAVSEVARQRENERGPAREWAPIPPSDMFRSFGTTSFEGASGAQAKASSVSIEVQSGDANEPTSTVRVGSVQEAEGESAQFPAAAKPRTRARASSIGDPREQTRKLSPAVLLATRVVAFSVLLILAYLFLDAGRRQRYIWPRRIALAAAFAGVCVLLWRIGPLM